MPRHWWRTRWGKNSERQTCWAAGVGRPRRSAALVGTRWDRSRDAQQVHERGCSASGEQDPPNNCGRTREEAEDRDGFGRLGRLHRLGECRHVAI